MRAANRACPVGLLQASSGCSTAGGGRPRFAVPLSGNKRVHDIQPGMTFGQLTVIKEIRIDLLTGKNAGKSIRGCLVECSCGVQKAVQVG